MMCKSDKTHVVEVLLVTLVCCAALCVSASCRRLSLANNSLTGTLPTLLSDYSSLTSLDVSHNGLTGTAPNNVSGLASLLYVVSMQEKRSCAAVSVCGL